MLSAVKNFALTLVISLLIFSVLAYVVVGMVLTNLSGITGNTETEETAAPDSPVITDSEGGIIDITLSDSGRSFNMLIALTDYDPSVYTYDPAVVEHLSPTERPGMITPAPVPEDLSEPRKVPVTPDSDPEDGDYLTTEKGDPLIPGGLYENDYKSIRTTQIILLRFDLERSEVTFSAFPNDTAVVMGEKYIELWDIYAAYGKEILCDEIHSITGCLVDNYAILDPQELAGLIDALGGVYFDVPWEVKCIESGNSTVVIKEGGRRVDGKNALRILSFDLYFENGQSRENTAVEFARAVLSNITQITNYPNAYALFEKLSSFADTDFTRSDFEENRDFIYKYPQLQNGTKSPMTRSVLLGGEQRTIIDEIATLSLFAEYRRIMPGE